MKSRLLLLFLCLTQFLTAQTFVEVPGTPFEEVTNSSIAFSDVDDDGDADVLITGQNSSIERIAKLYTNDGTGTFTEMTGTSLAGADLGSMAFSDVDGDGDEDVLITGQGEIGFYIAKLFTNDGTGIFTEVMGTPFEEVIFSSIAFSDVDDDGDSDVLITGEKSDGAGIAKLYTNDGTGTFTEVMGTPFDGVKNSSVAFADVDGDNDTDVLISGLNNSDERVAKLYTNDGMGNFTEMMGTPFDGVWSGSIAFSDVDGDGDTDVLITGFNTSNQNDAELYTNDGTGTFTEVMGTPFAGVQGGSVAFSDVDGDGDEDVLITGLSNSGEYVSKFYTNDGTGTFTEVTDTPFEDVGASSIAFADVDGDNDPDLLITGINNSEERIAKLYTNEGTAAACELSNLTLEASECDMDGNFTVEIDFNFTDVGSAFQLSINGTPLEFFSYDELPLTIGPLSGDGTAYSFQVEDVDNPDCAVEGEIPTVLCTDECTFYNVVTEPMCLGDDSYLLTVDFDFVNEGALGFDLAYNGAYQGVFQYSDLPLELGPFPVTGEAGTLIMRDKQVRPCKFTFSVDPVICTTDCLISGLTVETGCTDENVPTYTLDFDVFNQTMEEFELSLNGFVVGQFPLASLPQTVDSNFGNPGETVSVTVCIPGEEPACCASLEVVIPACPIPVCQLSNLQVVEEECLGGGMVELVIDFDFMNTGGAGFSVGANNQLVGSFDYTDLPVTIGPIMEGPVSLKVRDNAERSCSAVLDYVSDCPSLRTAPADETPRVDALYIYPNPTREWIQVVSETGVGVQSWEMIDLHGRTLRSGSLNATGEISLAGLPNGVYLLRFVTSGGPVVKRVVKQ